MTVRKPAPWHARVVVIVLLFLCASDVRGDGNLVFIETHQPHNALEIEVSPDGQHVYTGTDGRLHVYTRDAGTGKVTLVQLVDGAGPPLAISPDGGNVYATNRHNEYRLVVFTRDSLTGMLSELEFHTGGDWTFKAPVVSPDGGQVYVPAYFSSANAYGVRVYTRNTITGALTLLETHAPADYPGVAISPDGAHVYLGGNGLDSTVYSRDSGTGALTPAGTSAVFRPAGFSADGAYAYSIEAKRVIVSSRDSGTGQLTFVEAHEDGVGNVEGIDIARNLEVAPDGRHVYVVGGYEDYFYPGELDHDIAVFARDAASGRLSLREVVKDNVTVPLGALYNPRGLAVSPDGLHVYAGGTFGSLTALRRVVHACSPTPLPGCRPPSAAPRGATIVLKDNAINDKNDRVDWKTPQSTGTTFTDFGDPLTATDYALCIYDGSAAPQPILSAGIPAGGYCKGKPCWKAGGTDDFKYKDPSATHEGSSVLRLKALGGGLARIVVTGKGRRVPLPAMPLTTPVTGQLQASNGACWTATVGTPRRNDAAVFTGKSS